MKLFPKKIFLFRTGGGQGLGMDLGAETETDAFSATNTTSADAQDTLYSMTNVFTIDFTSISTWSLVFSATVTGAGT